MTKQKWSIIEFYEKSWHLLWEHKKLWILGFAALIYAAGSRGGRFQVPDFADKKDSQQKQTQELLPTPLPEATEQGSDTIFVNDTDIYHLSTPQELTSPEFLKQIEADTAARDNKLKAELEPLLALFKSVPQSLYVLLAVEFLALIAYSIVLAFTASAWAEVALMKGVAQAHAEDKVNLTESSLYATTKIKSFLWVKYIPMLRFFILSLLALLGGGVVIMILSQSLGDLLVIIAMLSFAIAAGFFAYLLFRLSFRVLYAKWHCVIDNLSGAKAFAKGITTTTSNLQKSFVLVFANIIVSMLSSFLFILPLIFLVVIGFLIALLSGIFTAFSVAKLLTIMPFLAVLLVVMIVSFSLIGAILRVFYASVWYLAFKAIKK